MANQRANRLYFFNQFVTLDPNEAPPDLNKDWGIPSVSLLGEQSKGPFFAGKQASEIVGVMEEWVTATLNQNRTEFSQLSTPLLNPVVVNVEAFGRVFGDAIENLNAALSNVRAAVEIIKELRQTFSDSGIYRPIGAYITIPKARFFEAYGLEQDGLNGYTANFYEKVNAATIELLSQHVDFFVLDGYVPWVGVPEQVRQQFFPTITDPKEVIVRYLEGCKQVETYPHYRYPGLYRPNPNVDYISVPLCDRGIGFWNVSDWPLHTIRFIRYQMELVARHSRGQPVMIWTSTTYLPNDKQYNKRPIPSPTLNNPVWDLLIEESAFRRYMQELVALNPWAIVLLEGFSSEKLEVFDSFGAVTTNPESPWPPGQGPRRAGLRWGKANGDPLDWKHPYLESLIADFKPTVPSP